MLHFREYIDRKLREAIKQLKILKKLFESQGLKVKQDLETDDNPYIYVYNPNRNTFFEGIRIYKIGDQIAFRIQKDEKTQPFGKAYPINVEAMFEDFMEDEPKSEKAGKEVIKAVVHEVQNFFKKSAEAEKELRSTNIERDPWNRVVVRSYDFGVDYGSYIHTKS